MSANTVATNARIASEGAASRAQSALQHAATIKKDLMVHGIMPDGSMDSNAELTAQAIAKGQLPPPTGMALLNPKNQRILGRVMEINPSYDFTDVTAKRAAATAFTTGKQGDALRFVSTANAHLDQMGDLVAAMENHDTKVINRVSNWYKEQTGKPAPTTFDAVKNIVGQEVVKAIVANGGTGTERDEAAKSFSRSNSPAQLTEIIRHYRMIMGAQADNLLAQRRAVGLSDKTLPKYNTTTQGGNTPANSVLDAADAILNRGK